jgi:hypothetical protein
VLILLVELPVKNFVYKNNSYSDVKGKVIPVPNYVIKYYDMEAYGGMKVGL